MAHSIHHLYGDLWGTPAPEFEEALKQSLRPRDMDCLYEMLGEWGDTPDTLVLDIGCRYADHAVEIVERFGCRAVAVDPIPLHVRKAEETVANAEMEDRIAVKEGSIEAIPLDDAAVEFVWCRDMLNHVNLPKGLAECARVLKPGGIMFIYQTFATERLEPKEADRLFGSMSIVPENMNSHILKRAAKNAGFEIVKRDPIDSEWREHSAEHGSTDLLESLLAVARMRRREGEWVKRYGRDRYEATYGSELWGIYQMLGKLCPTVYVLKKRSS